MATAEALAQLSQALADNEAFQGALNAIRSSALESLVQVEATNLDAILALQARVKVVDELRGNLEGFIRQGKPKKKPGIV
ncbi:MAG: hypothetical protein E5X94_00655 [Mesorhizobium sp.]|uniref:hypothetical protein n=1 Tax=unclassified Mesorhizobium TaxID=325217 RepID=UPI000FCB8665|nr:MULTISPECIES: hypothetical protein [unclassified Mesorhizobium]RUW04041.1 hypothetical protein EOA49_00495 [Mesorhizobium sp. M1A.F.Ca.IN.020.04.1.1]RUW04104.1 hypothetical protein EOA49_00830 [Mesorhizobium sp. M1A.F.Ca.IN.020.04.1.1]TIN82760.1 MAG: hypothetical protein E5X97_29080 [Mesorhizobium sp.]TIN88348.1 MAG: hypothetical protein E5X94_00655 [Mesorhizobium sp.]TIO88388.1 MAG: hypothetical protein E5Y00_05405 [Mesorhizobium sp.]